MSLNSFECLCFWPVCRTCLLCNMYVLNLRCSVLKKKMRRWSIAVSGATLKYMTRKPNAISKTWCCNAVPSVRSMCAVHADLRPPLPTSVMPGAAKAKLSVTSQTMPLCKCPGFWFSKALSHKAVVTCRVHGCTPPKNGRCAGSNAAFASVLKGWSFLFQCFLVKPRAAP